MLKFDRDKLQESRVFLVNNLQNKEFTEKEYDLSYLLYADLRERCKDRDSSKVIAAAIMLLDNALAYHEKAFGGDEVQSEVDTKEKYLGV